ncbi:MAG: PD-(D/E)XK nuclease family protein [Omnitrophica bacterium]|nr:PD-(D/E)XK nuclease family protein [Candidatus Omnitrophota bacterium]
MERVITYNFGENFIRNLTDYLCDNYLKPDNDLSRVACIFGGRRPALFLRKELSRRIKKSFIPPKIFSIDEFIDYVIAGDEHLPNIGGLDSYFLIYNLAKKYLPNLLKKSISFSEFIPWAKELISFIEQLDLEDIKDESLHNIEKSAAIGYDIPESINTLLEHIVTLRKAYHDSLSKKGFHSRGLKYLLASKAVKDTDWLEFEKIVFCNFFYLHTTEQKIINGILEKNKGVCIWQGSQEHWSVLKKNSLQLKMAIKPKEEPPAVEGLCLYQGFDIHSQVCLVRGIINKKINRKNSTVIVVPRPETIIPLLTEVSCELEEFNVSMGYPLKRSSFYALFGALGRVQKSKKGNKYYTKDYLSVLRQPLIKNLKLFRDQRITRIIVHKIEELLQGSEESSVGGSLFLGLKEIEQEEKIYLRSAEILNNMEIEISLDECKEVLLKLHEVLFEIWENIDTFKIFAERLGILLDVLIDKSLILNFPFNFKVIDKLRLIGEEFRSCSFGEEIFSGVEIWEVFEQKLQSEIISFQGSPLKGTQILGLLETRSLNFDNVIIMDANESVFPKLKIYEPLIPREVMLSLGLNRLEKEEEIQRYQFMRLISSAKNTHLIYEENQKKEKSRFIEGLLWQKQKQQNRLEVIKPYKAYFSVNVKVGVSQVKKTPEILRFLKESIYSASRINTYLACPQQFYFQYVLGLKESQDLLEGPDAAGIGTFIHELLEEAFGIFKGQKPVIDSNFKKRFFKLMDNKFDKEIVRRMKSDSFLLKGIIRARLEKFLEMEAQREVAKIICLEERRRGQIKFNEDVIDFRYTVDRIDELSDGSILIIDYKTGGSNYAPKSFAALKNMAMSRDAIKNNIKSFQLPIYYHLVLKDYPRICANAELYNIRKLQRKALFSESDLSKKDDIMQVCLEALSAIFTELFDLNCPFEADRHDRRCRYCPFQGLCR